MIIPKQRQQPDYQMIVLRLKAVCKISSSKKLADKLKLPVSTVKQLGYSGERGKLLPWVHADILIRAAQLNLDDEDLRMCRVDPLEVKP